MDNKLRQDVINKTNGNCAYCGCTLKKFQIDHIIPQRNFEQTIINTIKVPTFLQHLKIIDVNNIDNLFAVCQSCNNYKSTFDLELFRSEISALVNRLNLRFSQYKIAKRYNLLEETNNKVVFYFETMQDVKPMISNSCAIELLKEVRHRLIFDLDENGEPKSSISDLVDMWGKVNDLIGTKK